MAETLISDLIKYAVEHRLDKELGLLTRPAMGYTSLWWAHNKILTDEEVERGLSGDPEAAEKLIEYVLWYIENYVLASYALVIRVAGRTHVAERMRDTATQWIRYAQELARRRDLRALLDFASRLGLKPI